MFQGFVNVVHVSSLLIFIAEYYSILFFKKQRQGLALLLRLVLNPGLKRSSCLGLPNCWDYRHEPLCPAWGPSWLCSLLVVVLAFCVAVLISLSKANQAHSDPNFPKKPSQMSPLTPQCPHFQLWLICHLWTPIRLQLYLEELYLVTPSFISSTSIC